jgi:hypothetical protein
LFKKTGTMNSINNANKKRKIYDLIKENSMLLFGKKSEEMPDEISDSYIVKHYSYIMGKILKKREDFWYTKMKELESKGYKFYGRYGKDNDGYDIYIKEKIRKPDVIYFYKCGGNKYFSIRENDHPIAFKIKTPYNQFKEPVFFYKNPHFLELVNKYDKWNKIGGRNNICLSYTRKRTLRKTKKSKSRPIPIPRRVKKSRKHKK